MTPIPRLSLSALGSTLGAAALAFGLASFAAPGESEARSAFRIAPEAVAAGSEPLATEVGYKGRGPGYRVPRGYYQKPRYRHYPRHGYSPRYRSYPSYRYRSYGGAAAAAGIAGFALGAIAGSQPRYQGAPVAGSSEWYAYCARKYRSFDPRSGTYLGYDGHRHYCRVP